MKRARLQDNEEYGQLGIIESVCLRNFMCHDNLSFDFDPHMNFIIGQNGSGKSAVLTAVILALGGKSGSTGRHSNIKGFIKTGKHTASVSVSLKNCGPEAYKPKDYGSKITVERHFNSDGISHYKLKSQSGQIISTSKEELNNILSNMDIQIENPITVLTQEISRNFLVSKNSKSHKLFQLFYSGTGLEKVEEDYKKSAIQTEEAIAETKLKKNALPDMEKEIKNLRRCIERTSKLKELKIEFLWAVVNKCEKDRDDSENVLQKVKNEIFSVNEKIDACKSESQNLKQILSQAQVDKQTAHDKLTEFRKKLQDLTNKRNELTSVIREKKGTYSRYEREVNRYSNEASNLENYINDTKLKNQSDINEDKLRHDAKINALKEHFSQLGLEIKRLDQKKDVFFETIAGMNKDMDTLQAEAQDLTNSLRNTEREKQNLMAGLKDRIDVYGPEMKPLLQDIQNASKSGMFRVEPLGPIGRYLNVKDPEWNFAVQECLKINTLKTFICDNHADASQLTKIINKHYASSRIKPSIVTTKFVSKMFDVGKFKTVCDHPTVLDMLEIKNPVVANCLIDQKQIENILLIADQKAAVDLMMDRPPKNCLSAYTMSGDQLCHTPYRYYSCKNNNRICFLKTVNQNDISQKDLEMQYLNSELAKRVAAKNKLQQELNKADAEKVQNDKKVTDLRVKLKHLTMKLKDEENSYEEPKDINCLQSDLEELLEQKQANEEKLSDVKEEIRAKEEMLSLLVENIDECKDLLKEENDIFQDINTKIGEYVNKEENLNSSIKKLESQLKILEPKFRDCEQKLKNYNGYYETAKKTAEDVGPRVETTRSPDVIRTLLKETKEAQAKKNVDPETLVAEYEEKVERYNKAVADFERQERNNAQMKQMMVKRFEEFKKVSKNNVVSLCCGFTTLLKTNGFSGYPAIDLEAQTLEIFAKPNKIQGAASKDNGDKQNLAQLSGGERSYVTIAFLLALWERIQMPFRILDEYDVFMDSNNRHRSINLLIQTARANRKVQYVFLSPLELPPMADSEHVKVHKMPAPKR